MAEERDQGPRWSGAQPGRSGDLPGWRSHPGGAGVPFACASAALGVACEVGSRAFCAASSIWGVVRFGRVLRWTLMRSVLVALLVFGSLPLIVIKPHVGVLVWSWISYMNPHRLTWGFTYDFPLAMVVGLVTIAAWLFSREPKSLPRHPLVLLLAMFAAWVSFTTLFAVYPDQAQAKWDRTIKVLLFNGFVTLGLITTRQRLDALIWVIVLSLGFFALKGAAFTLLTGGNYRLGDRRGASSPTTTRSAWRS